MKYILQILTLGAILWAPLLPCVYADTDKTEESSENELAAIPAALKERKYVTKVRPKLDAKVYFIYQSRYRCSICVAEAPAIVATYKKMKGKGAELVMLNIDQDDKTAATWAKKAKMKFPIVSPTDIRNVPFPFTGGRTLPCMVAVDAEGNKLGEANGSGVADFLATNWKQYVREIKAAEKKAAKTKEQGD